MQIYLNYEYTAWWLLNVTSQLLSKTSKMHVGYQVTKLPVISDANYISSVNKLHDGYQMLATSRLLSKASKIRVGYQVTIYIWCKYIWTVNTLHDGYQMLLVGYWVKQTK